MNNDNIQQQTSWLVRALTVSTLLGATLVGSANAGLITQHVSVGAYDRSCPGLADSQYLDMYREGIESVVGSLDDWGDQAVDTVCRFNSTFQASYWNNDGTPKYDGLPNIPAFTNAQVGTLVITQSTGTSNLSLTTPTGRLQGDVRLDEANLGLPEIKINATSAANERNSFNGYAATEYLWTGADETLEFQLNFDFFHSSEEWSVGGLPATKTSDLVLNAYVSEGLIVDPNGIFPQDSGIITVNDEFVLSESNIGPTSAEDPYFGNLSVSFDVTAGQTFFVVGQYQGFAKNGGFLNAYNTITGALNVEGLTQQESTAIFATSLQAAPVTAASAPVALLLTLLGGSFVFARSKRQS
ncbi:MAG: hypothetical protein WA981_15950 [Glaciecola sp.]